MKRHEMTCATCIKRDESLCRLNPEPYLIRGSHRYSWCSQGVWHVWSTKLNDWVSYFWGEWEVENEQTDKD